MSDQTPPTPPSLPPTGYAPTPPLSPADEKLWAILLHIGGILFSFVAPLIGYLILKDRGPFINWHAKQALNFSLTMLIGYVVSVVLWLVFIGVLTYFAVYVLSVVFGILAAVAANRGEWYRYPFAIEFVR